MPSTEITMKNIDAIDDTATYDLFSIDNLRTGAYHQCAVISGADLRKVFARTTEPRRVVAQQIKNNASV